MQPTPEAESKPARLEISGGKSADIEPVRKRQDHQIVVKPLQRRKTNLTVYKVPSSRGKSVYMAFGFELRKKMYFPVVAKDSEKQMCLKIQPKSEFKHFSESFLFKWENNGEYGSLCSVVEPKQYLHVLNNQVTLDAKPDIGFRIQFLESKN